MRRDDPDGLDDGQPHGRRAAPIHQTLPSSPRARLQVRTLNRWELMLLIELGIPHRT